MSMIENGDYAAKVVNVDFGESRAGNDQICITFELTDTGENISWYGSFTEKATQWTIKAMKTAGHTGHKVTDVSTMSGTEVSLRIEQDEWDGKVRPKVKWINDPGGGAKLAAPLNQAKKASLDERLAGKMVAFEQSQKSAPQPPKPDESDDVPF